MASISKKLIKNVSKSLKGYDWSRFNPANMDRTKLWLLLRSTVRPISSYSEIKYENKGSLFIANIICLAVFVIAFLEYRFEGFILNYNVPENFSFSFTLLSSSLLIFLWTVSNWGICSLLDGEGKFREIWIMTCYALLPKVLVSGPLLLLSNIITLEESSLYSLIGSVVTLWCGTLLILGMMVVHQYTVRKTIASAFLTVFGIAILMFLAVLFYSMYQQLVTFIVTIAKEIRYRL